MMLLRVIVSPQEIRRVTLQEVPPSVDELCVVLGNTLGLRVKFLLQFEDPDFGNELCNLTDIKDLPTERATLKVLFTFSEPVSDSTLDTASLSSQNSASPEPPSSGDSSKWPDPFVIPDFSHDVEFQLRVANDAYAKDGAVTVISKSVKSEILDRLADSITRITCYPSKDNLESIAKALVAKHPCLREPGSGKGWYCWRFSLIFKMGNYRQRMMAAGCPEVLVNKRKRKGNTKPVKKAKKGEIHYLPEPPDGQTTVKSEKDRETMLLEVQKREPDLHLLDELMTATFSQRRQEIIGDEPLISAVKDRWPALFSERQLSAEFSRIVTKDLLESFLDLMPWCQMYGEAAASGRRVRLSSVLSCLQKEAHGETLDVLMSGMQVGLLIGHEGPLHDAFPLDVFNVALVVEEKIFLHDLRDVHTGFAMLLGAIYCLNLEYPRNMKYSFEFLQRVVMNIKPDQCSARIHGLRNKLLRYRM
ncbi:Sterile alpha motif domain-containing protein 3 [Merluccius polli]|uniref:Sterile alpha motif domain-containing protein 3 n=1 Tax=Merluccius polli TaxID=89951 RepID=A0AA47NAP5_MERPO|nr:Sterile alpha motif domain-containing protein 3 [Merluccius polli]